MPGRYELIGSKGCGSVVVELALTLAGTGFDTTDLPYLERGAGRDRLLSLNPLGQVPTLLLPDGTVMTESAAMILHLADVAPGSGLAPDRDHPQRPAFLNLLVLLVAAIYPTFTFGDDPASLAGEGEGAARLRAATEARKAAMWQSIEAGITPSPFVFGDAPTGVDLYLAVMRWWRPGRAWFDEHCPKITAVADAVADQPDLKRILDRHFA